MTQASEKPQPRKRVTRQQLLSDLKSLMEKWDRGETPLSDAEKLRCDLTRTVDNSPCSYEVVIRLLSDQIKWLKKARRDEHGR